MASESIPSSVQSITPGAHAGERVIVAMSGGVDSCAAALILAEAGYDVVGISMQVWDYRKNGGNAKRATCCAPSDFDDAREIADARDFPYYVFDFEDSFHDSVIQPFVNSYLQGLTPNPCLDCNRKVKFRELRRRAASLGSDLVATGHYAQIRPLADGTLGLFTSVDEGKDQSYFLYAMTQQDLKRTLFPVGHMRKPEVRTYLEARGFKVAKKAESQDICFVSSSVGAFIERETGKSAAPGKIISSDGRTLGEHNGIYQYTVGQRRGLGVSDAHPLYVINIDASANAVTVGGRDELERSEFSLSEVNWISGALPSGPIEAVVKLRYRHGGVRCRLEPTDSGVRGTFIDEWTPVSPGQAAVFYAPEADLEGRPSDGTVLLLGGGIIQKD